MAEETVWRGSVSQWKNFGFFLIQVLAALATIIVSVLVARASSPEIRRLSPYILILLAVPIFIAAKRYLQTKCTIYEVTTERLKTIDGVFSKVTETLEFNLIKEIQRKQTYSL